MKSSTLKEIKTELQHCSQSELLELCLRLGRFKKENKELLTYLLFEANDENGYIESVKEYIDEQFEEVNTKSYYFIRKSVRKILTNTKKFIRYSKNKETEVELLLYFCKKLKDFRPSIKRSVRLMNVYTRQLAMIEKTVSGLHEDLQYDYQLEIERLGNS
ncbi:hypothetical protein [Urechidicola vernalis]|uniref:Uncharacterized protein n=1 Tax=Urechidicola vernalis TaxID=3075600 RepID=A0ABU2Y9B9_9FLAO|nr:hypothetical protein [Urechidicola sp. P050]MDT0553855.1 hypothetical protein [Urechidicola sp. P050]